MKSWAEIKMGKSTKSFRIAIDARMYQESGIGRYVRNLLEQLQNLDKKNEYYILHLKDEYDSLVYHTNFHKILADFRWYSALEQIKLPILLNKLDPDLVHFPHFNVPIFYNGKFVVTIHDLIHQHFKMRRVTTHYSITYKIKQMGYDFVFKNAIKKSLKILVPSSHVKELLVKEWKVEPAKIVVTHEAVDDKILAIANSLSSKRGEEVLRRFGIKPPYIFYVGNAHPHKNVEGLIKAFLQLRKQYQYLTLVLSGNDHYFWQRLKKENKHQGIIYTGYVNDEELVALYKNTKAFVMPSYEEGFGIPLLEAMASFTAVVSSNAGALPEVGGYAALYFDPQNTNDMVDKISQVLDSEKLKSELIAKGQKRVKFFSWEELTKQTLEVYRACV